MPDLYQEKRTVSLMDLYAEACGDGGNPGQFCLGELNTFCAAGEISTRFDAVVYAGLMRSRAEVLGESFNNDPLQIAINGLFLKSFFPDADMK